MKCPSCNLENLESAPEIRCVCGYTFRRDEKQNVQEALILSKYQQYIVNELSTGVEKENIIDELVKRGINTTMARNVVERVCGTSQIGVRKSGYWYLISGLLLTGGGILATMTSYSGVKAKGGGTYYIFWGLVFIGLIWVMRGLSKISKFK